MSLLQTRTIRIGSLLAFTADPSAMNGVSLLWGNPEDMGLGRGDVVQVMSIEVGDGSTWAKVQVLILRGKRAGRTGHVSIDMSERRQRCWQGLTTTGSMAAVRLTKSPTGQTMIAAPPVSYVRPLDEKPDTDVKSMEQSWSFDLLKELG